MTQAEAEQSLHDALKAVHTVFRHHRGKTYWGDPLADRSKAQLQRPSVVSAMELTRREVVFFYSHVALWSGELGAEREHTRYFIRRIFDDLTHRPPREREKCIFPRANSTICHQGWWLGERLALAQWTTWPAAEREAVRNWLIAWWRACVVLNPSPTCIRRGRDVNDALAVVTEADVDLGQRLREWIELGTPATIKDLSEVVTEAVQRIGQHLTCGTSPMATGSIDAGQRLLNHLLNRELGTMAEARFFQTEGELAEALSELNIRFGWIRNLV